VFSQIVRNNTMNVEPFELAAVPLIGSHELEQVKLSAATLTTNGSKEGGLP